MVGYYQRTMRREMNPIIETSWVWRRSVVLATLFFCGITVGYIVWSGPDDRVRETAIMALSTLAGATIGSYLFGAAWDDSNKRAASLQAYSDTGYSPGPYDSTRGYSPSLDAMRPDVRDVPR